MRSYINFNTNEINLLMLRVIINILFRVWTASMRSSAKYATICSIIFATSSCDPAQRLQITNLTDNNIELQKQDLYPDFVGKIGNDSLNRIVIISPGDYFTEFYGIGGWWDNSEIQMKHHLDSIISVKVQGKFMTRVTLSEFGESLMTYEIRD